MHVEVGPVAPESVAAYATFARGVLHARGPSLPPDVAETFEIYVDEWTVLGQSRRSVVTWAKDIDIEVCEYLVLAFYRLAQQVDADHVGSDPVRPTDAMPFYQALVEGVLAAMAESGSSATAEFSDHLRSFWPSHTED